MTLSYKGNNYYGWAIQPNVPTIQRDVELVVKSKVNCTSRTDRYVHAKKQVVSFTLKEELSNKDKNILKNDIKLLSSNEIKFNKIVRCDNDFNPRYASKGKLYKYRIYTAHKNLPRHNDFFYHYKKSIDLEKIKSILHFFKGEKNYASYTAKENYTNWTSKIDSISIKKRFNNIYFYIKGTRFLRFQIRNIVGVLLAYERGALSLEDVRNSFEEPKKGKMHYKAPGSGLYLLNIYF